MLTEQINAINYFDGNVKEVEETIVQDETITITINGTIKRSFSGLKDSLKEFAVGYLFNENLVETVNDIKKVEINDAQIDAEINDRLIKSNETVLCSDSAGGWRSKISNVKKVKSDLQVTSGEILARIEELKNNAEIWQATGGTHVAGIACGKEFVVKEDVSRHVAVDKVIGYGILNGFDLSNSYVVYSGRMPADMVIKVTRVGIPILVSNAAPAYSGYKIAEKGDVTLVGFVRGQRFNVYNNLGRVIFDK